MKTLILGGYGNFGARICRALSHDNAIEIFVCGRDLAKAWELAQTVGGKAMQLDINAPDLAQKLKAAGAQIVLHTAGPYQAQGYHVAQACAQAGAHYIDLADGRRFVCDFASNLDSTFKQASRIAITGASTVPALSSAVVEHLCAGWQQITSIDICIGPAQTAPRGDATMAAVLSYCGEPIEVWQNGKWQTQYGWAQPVKVEFARMKPRLGALCDIPDLELFPQRYAGVQNVMFRAALELRISQRVFALLATMRRKAYLQQPQKLAGFINRSARFFDWMGSSLGGMVLRVQGMDEQGRRAQRAWHIAADDDHGPEIPTMAALILVRKIARGLFPEQAPGSGAMTAAGLVKLEEFSTEFAKWGMVTDIFDEAPATQAGR